MENSALKLRFNGGSVVPLLTTNSPNFSSCSFFLRRSAPITQPPVGHRSAGSGRVPRYRRRASSPAASPNQAALTAAEAFGERGGRGSPVDGLRVEGSCPVQLLRDDGDWSKDRFRAAVEFLRHASRSPEILPLFEAWKNIEPSRITGPDYEEIIGLLCEEGLLDDAASALRGMKTDGLMAAALETCNSVLHGLADRGRFKEASFFLDQMRKQDLVPDADTYEGLIRAYGKHRMFDEMGSCVRWMEADRCSPDHVTYNLLIREYSRGGLINRMESVVQKLFSKRMYLQPSTLFSILEVYTNFGILEKMERAYVRVLRSKVPVTEGVIRRMASVYLENFMFSRLEELGLNHGSDEIGELSWCLRLLSHACVLSQRGIDSTIDEMEDERVPWSATLVNIVLLAYLKMKDIKSLRISLSELHARNVKPDIVTVGVLLDMKRAGFDVTRTLDAWKRTGFLYGEVELTTDPLVLGAIGKGHFLKSCEEIYSGLEPEARDGRWTYSSLINRVLEIWEPSRSSEQRKSSSYTGTVSSDLPEDPSVVE